MGVSRSGPDGGGGGGYPGQVQMGVYPKVGTPPAKVGTLQPGQEGGTPR